MKHLLGTSVQGKAVALFTNIRLGLKGLQGTFFLITNIHKLRPVFFKHRIL
jgi:hypothetical protein